MPNCPMISMATELRCVSTSSTFAKSTDETLSHHPKDERRAGKKCHARRARCEVAIERPKACMLVADLKLNALSCSLGTLWKTLAMPKALETMAVAFPCSLAVLKAWSRSRPTRSLDRSIFVCWRAFASAWSSRTRPRIGLARLSNLEAQASAELPLLQLG